MRGANVLSAHVYGVQIYVEQRNNNMQCQVQLLNMLDVVVVIVTLVTRFAVARFTN